MNPKMICYFQEGGQWYMGTCKWYEDKSMYDIQALFDRSGNYVRGYLLSLPAEKVFFERPAEKIINEEFYK